MNKICDECETVAHCTKHGCVPKQQALDKMAENARELGLDYEPAQPVTPCTHPSLGACSLREDGTASRWNCVMCGTEFVPKATNRWAEFNETTKRNIQHAEWYLSIYPQPAQQEPIAWYRDEDGIRIYYESKVWDDATPLYTSPPASKPWVGLDHDDIHALMNEYFYEGMQPSAIHFANFARAIEAKLKEKNT